jgi:ribosomal protein S18 acetylase RimI-like enzyme
LCRSTRTRHAAKVHALLVAAYVQGGGYQGGGYVEPFAIWWPSLTQDAEYDPALCFVAADEGGDILGVAQCWTSAFVKDLAVSPSARRRGLGSALLCHAAHTFRERGSAVIDLKVDADNPSGALHLYRSLGFREIESYRLR